MPLANTGQSLCDTSGLGSFTCRSVGLTVIGKSDSWRSGSVPTLELSIIDSRPDLKVSDGRHTCPIGYYGRATLLELRRASGRAPCITRRARGRQRHRAGVTCSIEMPISSLQIRDAMMAYLKGGGFTFFGPSKVKDYMGLGQIWVDARVSDGCLVRMVYDYGTGKNTIEFVERAVDATKAFYDELETIAMFWGETVASNTTAE